MTFAVSEICEIFVLTVGPGRTGAFVVVGVVPVGVVSVGVVSVGVVSVGVVSVLVVDVVGVELVVVVGELTVYWMLAVAILPSLLVAVTV
jgi:hypothetical protein